MTRKARIAAVAGALLFVAGAATAQKAVLVVRHGEKISSEDERLTDAGKARGQRLAKHLADTGIAAVYSTDTERTLGTARPLADARRLTVTVYDKDKPKALAEKVRAEHAGDVILVVGHSNTVPKLLKAFGCAESVSIADDEYDNLFVVVPNEKGPATLVRLKY